MGGYYMDKFRGKYRIPSTRWSAWDYGSNAAYFVTICTVNREHDFGEIVQNKMILNRLGQAAMDYWMEIPLHFPFVVLDGFVVMPNHVHGIVVINKPDLPAQTPTQSRNKFGPQSQNLASIIRGYKIGVTKFARQNEISFGWQTRYHDHVIRDVGEHDRIFVILKKIPNDG
jgi:putative transposase